MCFGICFYFLFFICIIFNVFVLILQKSLSKLTKGLLMAFVLLKSFLGVHWKDWCWSWNSSILATWCEELTHLKRPWCWERLKMGGEGDDRGWDGWTVSPTQWTWVWVNSRSWWWTERPGVLRFMESQKVGHDWVTDLNWTEGHGIASSPNAIDIK